MGKKKKIVSLIVSVAMLVAMFPMIVHADDEPAPGSFEALQAQIDSAQSPFISLDIDYTALPGEECITVNRMIYLDLNGHTLNRNLNEETANGHVIKVGSNGNLHLMNNAENVPSIIRGGYATNGGGIFVDSQGQLTFDTGNIIVAANNATQYGGGIFNAGQVCLYSGSITGNYSLGQGSGVYMTPNATLSLVNSPVITGNATDNLFLSEGSLIVFPNDLGKMTGAYVQVSAADDDLPLTFTSGYTTKMGSASPTSFFSVPEGYEIVVENDELVLKSTSSGPVVNTVEFKGSRVSLDGSVHLIAYFDLSSLTEEQKASAKVTFTVPGKGANTQEDVPATQTYTNQYYSGNTLVTEVYDGFECNLSAVQMAEQVAYSLTYDGAEDPITGTCSVEQYFEGYYNGGKFTTYNQYNYLFIPATCSFGYYLQPWLASVKGWTIGAGGYAAMSNLFNKTYSETDYTTAWNDLDATQYPVSKEISECPDIEKVQLSLEFDTTNSILVYFTLKEGSEEKLKASCEYGGKVFKAGKMDDGRYRIRISGISALSFDETFVISGTCGGEFSVTVSPLGYVRLGLKNHTSGSFTAKENAMMAIYEYWKYAEAYVQG